MTVTEPSPKGRGRGFPWPAHILEGFTEWGRTLRVAFEDEFGIHIPAQKREKVDVFLGNQLRLSIEANLRSMDQRYGNFLRSVSNRLEREDRKVKVLRELLTIVSRQPTDRAPN